MRPQEGDRESEKEKMSGKRCYKTGMSNLRYEFNVFNTVICNAVT